MTAGTPSLNRPLPDRSEAEARIERALRVARDGAKQMDRRYEPDIYNGMSLGRKALKEIISILDGKPTNGG